MGSARVNELINNIFEASDELFDKADDIHRSKVDGTLDVSDLDDTELIQLAYNIIKTVEDNDKDRYDAIYSDYKEKYGAMGLVYILEFTDKLMHFVGKFRSYSKRVICLGAILSDSIGVVAIE